MPVRKGLPTVEGTLGTQEERLRALEVHQHDELPDGSTVGGGKEYATFVIAASNSHPSGLKRADYVCSGGNDAATINQACQALVEFGGGGICLLEGTYNLGSTVTLSSNGIVSPVSMWGMGRATRLIVAEYGIEVYDNCSLARVNIDGQGTAFHGATAYYRSRIEDVYVTSCNTGFRAVGEAAVLRGCHAFDITEDGFEITGNHTRLTDCFVEQGTVDGNPGVVPLRGFNITAGKVHAKGLYVQNAVEYGINLTGGRCSIFGAQIDDSDDVGVRVTGSLNSLVSVDVSSCAGRSFAITGEKTGLIDCRVESPDDQALRISASNCRIIGFVVQGSNGGTVGIYCSSSHVVILGCVIEAMGGNGLEISGTACKIADNEIQGCGHHGILINAGKFNSITGNVIDDISVDTANTYDGIHLVDTDDNNIEQNTVRNDGWGNNRYGINVSNAACENNRVTNNDLLNSGTTGSFNDAGTGTITTAGNRL